MEENRKYYGSYKTMAEAEARVAELIAEGYLPEDISVLTKDMAVSEANIEHPESETVKDSTAIGAAVGTAGGLLFAFSSMLVPGLGPILAAGPVASLLFGAVAGAAAGTVAGGAVGGVAEALEKASVPAEDIEILDERFREGDIIVYVDPAKKAVIDSEVITE